MAAKKFTFKTEKPTGRYRSFFSETYHIKLNKIEIGLISLKEKHTDGPFKIRLMAIKNEKLGMDDGNPNCKWMWIVIKREFETIDDAKIYLNENFDKLTSSIDFYQGDD